MGCLVHAELIEHISDGQVSHIIGFSTTTLVAPVWFWLEFLWYLSTHMSMRSCSNSCTVVQGMLVLTQGTLFLLITSMILSVAAIHSKNLDDKEQCILWHMDPKISHNASNIWYEFLPCDGTHLYHLFNKSLGIDVTICPEQNLHNWLNPLSLHYNHPRNGCSGMEICPWEPIDSQWYIWCLLLTPSFYLLPWALMNTGKGFHWPLSYFQPLQETKQHVQATIRRFFVSFFTHGNHIFPMAKPHFFIPLLQSPTLTPKSRGPFKMSGQLFGGCSVSFIFDNVGPIVTRNWSLGRILIFGSSMYVEGHLS